MGSREVFKKNLPYYMARADMNQSELAKAVGRTKSTVTCWIQGKAYPRIDVIQSIADALGCTTDDLMLDKSPKMGFVSNSRPLHSEVSGMLNEMINADKKEKQFSRDTETKIFIIYRELSHEGKEYLLQQAEIAQKLYGGKK